MTRTSLENLDTLNLFAPHDDRNPMKRYLNSPPAEEGIPENVLNAIQNPTSTFSTKDKLGYKDSGPLYSSFT
jgi:hypothetical protein